MGRTIELRTTPQPLTRKEELSLLCWRLGSNELPIAALNAEKFLISNGFPLWTVMPHESARGHVQDVLLAAISSMNTTLVGHIAMLSFSSKLRFSC